MIRKQKIDIYDIPIAQNHRAVSGYLRLIQELNVDVRRRIRLHGGAVDLHQVPNAVAAGPGCAWTGRAEDPRAELVRRLLEYEKFKNAAQMLYQREMVEKVSWNNPGEVPFEDSETGTADDRHVCTICCSRFEMWSSGPRAGR